MDFNNRRLSILMLEDDPDDRYLTEAAFAESGYDIELIFLQKTADELHYLGDCNSGNRPFPQLILLDKNLPADSGFDTLRDIKSHANYKKIPVIMISGTNFPQDVNRAYELGVNSFIQKPFNNKLTVERISLFISYWFGAVELPVLRSRQILNMHAR